MKRTLVEILAAFSLAVILVSYHHQIDRLRAQQDDVARLHDEVGDVVALLEETHERSAEEQTAWQALAGRIDTLQARIVEASMVDADADALRAELHRAQQDVSRFQAEIARDFSRTRELVDAYHRQVKTTDRIAREELHRAQLTLYDLAERVKPDKERLNELLLSPTVQLNGDDTVGSGTLIYSRENPASGKVESYVLTSYHVVRNILADTPSARRSGISVTIYADSGNVEERGDMVSHDERIDAALIRLRSERAWPHAARCASRNEAQDVQTWDGIYAVGCPLGNDPIPTRGEISSTQNVLNGANYWMINAPTYFGNSGGGIYLAESRKLVGVFSKIYTHGRGTPVVVPHMGLCTPMGLIYAWLDRDELSYVLDSEERPAFDPTEDLAAPPPSK